MDIMLKDKVAIVTGGTRGIGFAMVKKFIEAKAKVVIWGSRKETAEAALKKLREIHPDCDKMVKRVHCKIIMPTKPQFHGHYN